MTFAIKTSDSHVMGRWTHVWTAYDYGSCLLRAGVQRVVIVDADTGETVVAVQPVREGEGRT